MIAFPQPPSFGVFSKDIEPALLDRIDRSNDPVIVLKLIAASKGNLSTLKSAQVKAILDNSDEAIYRAELGEAFQEKFGRRPAAVKY